MFSNLIVLFSFLFNGLTFAITVNYYPSELPEYCMDPITQQDLRNIPPLSELERNLVGSLKQVQAIIRHGARTPYTLEQCWNNYNITWNNCNITELMIANPSYNSQKNPQGSWLFRKIFDGSANLLGGNCLTGQLIYSGYLQQERNGYNLYEAYLNNGLYPNDTGTNADAMKLFPTNTFEDIPENQIYLRSDNEERTLMSGQILMHSFLNVSEEELNPSIVLWHTGDYSLDQIYPNSNVCPRLNNVQKANMNNDAYQDFNNSDYIKDMDAQLNDIWGKGQWSWYNSIDCLMTTTCTDRPIYGGVSTDGAVMNDKLFNDTVSNAEYTYSFNAMANNSFWSKLAMGRVAWEIRTRLQSSVDNEIDAFKFVLYSGHDTTVMPFLAAVVGDQWDGKWAPYASLITIELYESSTLGESDLFRLIYNSKPLMVAGCNDYLCNIQNLIDALDFGEPSMPCSVDDATTNTPSNNDDNEEENDYKYTIAEMIGYCILSGVIGIIIAISFVYYFNPYSNNKLNDDNIKLLESTTTKHKNRNDI